MPGVRPPCQVHNQCRQAVGPTPMLPSGAGYGRSSPCDVPAPAPMKERGHPAPIPDVPQGTVSGAFVVIFGGGAGRAARSRVGERVCPSG